MVAKQLISELLTTLSFPFTVLDVGSMGGIETEWRPFKENLRMIGVEPDSREFSKLPSTAKERYFNYALSRADNDSLKIHLSKETGKSSLFPPNMDVVRQFPDFARYETVQIEPIDPLKVISLDTLVAQENLGDLDFIKIDTQGSELMILEGGIKTLKTGVLGLKLEVEFTELYKGQPLFADVDAFMRSQGFDLVDLRRVFWKRTSLQDLPGKGQLIFGDALYFKNMDAFHAGLRGLPELDQFQKVLKFATICLTYQMYDWAYLLFDHASRTIPSYQIPIEGFKQGLKNSCQTSPALSWARSPKIPRILNRVSKTLGKSHKDFADSDLDLGNRRVS